MKNGNGSNEDVGGDVEKFLDSGYILKIGPIELGHRLNMDVRERDESKQTLLLIRATGRMGLSYTEVEKNAREIGLRKEL